MTKGNRPVSSNTLKILVACAAVAALSACASNKPPEPAPTSAGPAYMPPPPPPPPPPRDDIGRRQTGPIPGSMQDFAVNAGDRVFFDYDQYSVRGDAAPVLDKQAQWLGRYPQVQVRIEGNADERGTREYNFALAARRAEAVKSYLVGHGVQPGRITTISYGKERPLDDGGSEEAMAKNRNGHTAITSGAGG
jgi:peptidoglycan-associated lipoprotein